MYEISDTRSSGMKAKTLRLGILGIVLVFSLIFTACPTNGGGDEEDVATEEDKAPEEDVTPEEDKTPEEDTETFVNVAADFSLSAGQAGLTLISAQKSSKTGIVTINLGGTISSPSDFVTLFSPGGAEKVAGNYAYVSFSLASVLMPVKDQVIAIRQENDAFRYYSNSDPGSGNLLAEQPAKPVFGGAEPNIYIPASPAVPLKWKANAANAFTQNDAENCQFIVSSVASPKTITLGISTWSANEDSAVKTGDVALIIVDYTALTINSGS
jgi:hypothetical protein